MRRLLPLALALALLTSTFVSSAVEATESRTRIASPKEVRKRLQKAARIGRQQAFSGSRKPVQARFFEGNGPSKVHLERYIQDNGTAQWVQANGGRTRGRYWFRGGKPALAEETTTNEVSQTTRRYGANGKWSKTTIWSKKFPFDRDTVYIEPGGKRTTEPKDQL